LERYGFAEPAPARSDGRERPWRQTRRTRVELDTSTPAGAAATTAVGLAYFDRSRAVVEAFTANAYQEPEELAGGRVHGQRRPLAAVDEMRKLTAALDAVVEPYRGRAPADVPMAAGGCGS
jgi:hypothetical protein